MKKVIILVSLSLMCCFLQGCSSEQKVELSEDVFASLETVGIDSSNLDDGKFSFDFDDVNFLFKVTNESDSIYEIDEEKMADMFTTINQDGEVGAKIDVDLSNIDEIKPKQTEGLIIRAKLNDLDVIYDSIGIRVGEEKFLVEPSDNRIQLFGDYTRTRTAINLDSKDMSLDFNVNKNDDSSYEYDCNIANKTDRMLIIPQIKLVEADNYRTDTGLGESNLLDLNNFNSALEEAKDKDAIITNNDVIQYLKNGQDLTLEEITKYSAILADNDIYINEEEYIVQDYGIIKPNDNIEITNEVLPINGEVLRVLCQSSSSY